MPNHRVTHEAFIAKCVELHGNNYDYSKVVYTVSTDKVIITCKIHGDFEQQANSHVRGNGCPLCGRTKRKLTTSEFIRRSIEIHGDIYDYSKVKYETFYVPVILKCPVHGDFEIKPANHLGSSGCMSCGHQKTGDAFRFSQDTFIQRAVKAHGDKYDYSKVNYINNMVKVEILCKQHNLTFWQSPQKHWIGQQCPKCSHHKKYSNDAVAWLKVMEVLYSTSIQHVENGGEYRIPKTRYKADGYSKELNIVFEYYGNAFHGNPEVYDRDKVFIKSHKTYGEMYDYTLQREDEIKALGFHLVTIWEKEWLNAIKAVKQIQRLFRKRKQCI
jgi:Zn finger protein HypA/HybF involved in hydrogenase expression